MAELHFLPDEKKIDARPDETILQASLRAGNAHAHACGGNAQCSTCRVWVLNGIDHCRPRNTREAALAERLGFSPQLRLACQTTVSGPVKLRRLVLDDDDLEIANQLGRQQAGLVGQEKRVAILFSDIRGFTSFAEALPPYDVIYVLNRYFQQVGKAIYRHGGYIDNYMGDGLMAVFGAQDPADAPAGSATFNAVRAGLEMLEAQENFKPYLLATYNRSFEIGIGVHFGPAVLGALGYADSQKPSTIGDAVNLASRIEAANKDAGTRFLISEAAHREVQDRVRAGRQVTVDLKGKTGRYTLVEIVGLKQEAAPAAAASDEDGVRWVRVLPRAALLPNSHQTVKVGEQAVLLLHRRGQVWAVESRCPHMRLPLNNATVGEDQTLTCSWHHSRFSLEDGAVQEWAPWPPALGPALGALRPRTRLRVWPTRIRNGFIWVALPAEG